MGALFAKRALFTKLEEASGLDRIGDGLQKAAQSVFRTRRVRDFLHGVWLGHPLHPSLVQIPIGAWLSSAILDVLPGQRRAATTLVAVGTASALPTALAGVNDYAALSREQRRVGLVHAIANTVGLTCYAASLFMRLRGRHQFGRTLGLLGLGAATGGAYLGGHLAYRQAAQVNQGVSDLRQISDGWHRVGDLGSLPPLTLVRRQVDDVPVLVYRDSDRISVLLDRCSHQTGPLSGGQVVQVDGAACVVCPWHGSTFQLRDGVVVHGPAGSDQQVLPTRVTAGVLETRLP